ncbi:copii coat protein [Thecamonas trahens ATCC 50062]|uniref:Protein transport protein SEC23 n=1 Tax=Thecamonas trahens ATCC 50062 TaxID=461836 RepID=A0A0L0DTD8_THETB|nr:copii coat protein [Thecamonas trahens ATCC 50062]KNC55535.1 copii coat protein [Thecamonas trahens ATCC 50062]|eukprot:XP_013761309.1 copii coat protein [Thecamonas trahens ATCC 50062]
MAADEAAWSVTDVEAVDGIRFAWNVWPSSKVEATRMVVDHSCMYTPLKETGCPVLEYEPVVCRSGECRGILNPFCQIDTRNKRWVCPFCFGRNAFPQHYESISETSLPAELFPSYTTIEYTLRKTAPVPPIFLLVVDTAIHPEEIQSLKESLILSLSLLPENSLVGLITFGKHVAVHELGFGECAKSHIFRGDRDVSPNDVGVALSILAPAAPGKAGSAGASHRQRQILPGGPGKFLLPLSECDLTLTSILEELEKDPWPVPSGKRAIRAGGVALSVAASLLEVCYPATGARIMSFIGGPPTIGPGKVLSDDLEETIRAHHDLEKGSVPHFKPAVAFYEALASRLVANGHVLDMFACSGNQTGVLEVISAVNKTGGLLVLADSFTTSMFRESFKRCFARDEAGDLKMAFSATLEVQTTREFKVAGAIGPLSSLGKKSSCVAETSIGVGETSAWRLNGLIPQTSVALYFEVVNSGAPIPAGQQGLLQLTTIYRHASGVYRLRVTTVARSWADPKAEPGLIIDGFDQEAATVIMARKAVFKAEAEGSFDVIRWLDRMLIRLVAKFGDYQADSPSSLTLPPGFAMYPQFMFHLRRSQFLQVFNSSPDETAFYRHTLYRENVLNSLIMIQPSLVAYGFDAEPTPVLLDAASILPDRILLLDTFFFVLIFAGETIAAWKKEGYQELPEYESFKTLLQTPRDDALLILKDRWPVPRYIECDQYSSPARILYSKVDPSVTHNNMGEYGQEGGGQVILTDDVSLRVFMDHLASLAVSSQ